MSRNSRNDYLASILFRLVSPLIRLLPKRAALSLGRRIGDLLYFFDLKHKAIAYANIKRAFGSELSVFELKKLTHKFYRNFGQSIIEMFLIPAVDMDYVHKFVSFEGVEHIEEAFRLGKGVILLGTHAGSWELSNVICASLGFPFNLLVRDQRYERLNGLLNKYRQQKGCKVIERKSGVRQLIMALKNNEAIGMTSDQGGLGGLPVKFFGKNASMPTGAVKMALKYGCLIVPAYYSRINGPYIKTILGEPFKVRNTGNESEDLRHNVTELTKIFEGYIRQHPADYLWTYKIWKYSDEKNILILSDGKTGHLRQAQGMARIIQRQLKEKGVTVHIHQAQIQFRNKIAKALFLLGSCFSGKYHCQGCAWCLKKFLKESSYLCLAKDTPDIIISCGSSLAPVNFIFSRETQARSIVIMRPSFLSTRRFDLVVMPEHDHPPGGQNVLVTQGALNLVDEAYLKDQSERLSKTLGAKLKPAVLNIGLLLGGDAKNFTLEVDTVAEVISQIKEASRELNADVLLTTSRRTPKQIEDLVKNEFLAFPRTELLVIANEKNIPETVGGILGMSGIVITSAESISMISEAANSSKYVLVFKNSKLDKRHEEFLDIFSRNKYIYLVSPNELASKIKEIWHAKPPVHTLRDNILAAEAVKKIL